MNSVVFFLNILEFARMLSVDVDSTKLLLKEVRAFCKP